MTAQLTGHGAHDIHDAGTEQPYLARRQNWVNQLERHAYMQPGATALRFLGNTVTWADLRDRVAALAGALGVMVPKERIRIREGPLPAPGPSINFRSRNLAAVGLYLLNVAELQKR